MSAAKPEPFPRTLRALMKERKLTYRQLADATVAVDPDGKGLTHSYLNALVHDKARPSMRAIQLIAAALEISPLRFAEYRGAIIRRAFDDEAMGFGQFIAHTATLHRWLNETRQQDELTLGLLAVIEGRRSGAEWLEPPLGPGF